jgi:hypothetical protein
VVAVSARAASVALGERERDRRGGAFELIAKSGACGLREGGDHRGEFEGDLEGVEAFVVEEDGRGGRVGRDGSGGLGGCVFGREIQCGTPFKRNGPSAVLTRKDGACLHAWSPAVSRPKRSNRRDRHSCAAASCARTAVLVIVVACSSSAVSWPVFNRRSLEANATDEYEEEYAYDRTWFYAIRGRRRSTCWDRPWLHPLR